MENEIKNNQNSVAVKISDTLATLQDVILQSYKELKEMARKSAVKMLEASKELEDCKKQVEDIQRVVGDFVDNMSDTESKLASFGIEMDEIYCDVDELESSPLLYKENQMEFCDNCDKYTHKEALKEVMIGGQEYHFCCDECEQQFKEHEEEEEEEATVCEQCGYWLDEDDEKVFDKNMHVFCSKDCLREYEEENNEVDEDDELDEEVDEEIDEDEDEKDGE